MLFYCLQLPNKSMEVYEEISSSEDESLISIHQNGRNGAANPSASKPFNQNNHACSLDIRNADQNHQRIGISTFWTQSISPRKFYKRHHNGEQVGTSALHELHKEFEANILKVIQVAKAIYSCTDSVSTSSNYYNDRILSDYKPDNKSASFSHVSNEIKQDNATIFKETGRKERLKSSIRSKRAHAYEPEKKSSLAQKEIRRKMDHPTALHPDIGFNERGQLNDGPHCKCSWTAKQTGIRHDKFAGEQPIPKCKAQSSNIKRLHHYVLLVEPKPSKYSRFATTIKLDGNSYEFDGFSILFHHPLPDQFPQQPINQWTNDFHVHLVKESVPECFTIRDLELFHEFFFQHVLELYDLNRSLDASFNEDMGWNSDSSCLFYHCLPRFTRSLPDNGKELLPMSAVLSHFIRAFTPIDRTLHNNNKKEVLHFAKEKKGQIFLNPSKRPMAIRVDLIDSSCNNFGRQSRNFYPFFIHFGVKPSAYAFSKRPMYQTALKMHIKFRKSLIAQNGGILSMKDKRQLSQSKANLLKLRKECMTKRDTTIRIDSCGFYNTGLYPDIVQHALLLVLMCHHIRFHCSLGVLEDSLGYIFKNRGLLELALIHPSFRVNYGINPDHAKNTLNNCGLKLSKEIEKGTNRKHLVSESTTPFHNPTSTVFHQQTTRKRGIHALMEIMSMQGCTQAIESPVRHNERLEFLGDAVIEFLTTIHLFFLFNDLDEGGLATFRSALVKPCNLVLTSKSLFLFYVQNRHLATLAERIGLQQFMVYAHGPDLCHETDLRHAMANAFEALMAGIFLDSNLEECDRFLSNILFKDDPAMKTIWTTLPEHPLKRNAPFGDRHLIEKVPCLKLLAEFEESIGIRFKHIRLLAKAFTRRNVPYNFLTLGNNQRLEFLGDTVLQLLTTEYLYKHFPLHQEGHLSLLRTCLVSNKTQSIVCDELSMTKFLVIPKSVLRKGPQAQLRLKDKADLNESFIGALFVDRGLIYCRQFCMACFFPRLRHFITTQRWNDPKSQLQQCCLALREGRSGEPDIPEYKTIGIEGPTNTRIYRVAVYFRNKRLADGTGSSVHQAQMQAAQNALANHSHLFPTIINAKKVD